MLFEDSFKTIAINASGEFKDRGSTFIGLAFRVDSELMVKEIINSVKKEHPKANHHCYAFRIGAGGEASRFSDDREPSGSAGKPIFGVLRTNDLTNILIIVVRYFGGSLLGVPGLINAYRSAAQAAISNSEIVSIPITEKYKITFGYEELKEVSAILRIAGVQITSQNMEENCVITFEISKNNADDLIRKIQSNHIAGKKCKIEIL